MWSSQPEAPVKALRSGQSKGAGSLGVGVGVGDKPKLNIKGMESVAGAETSLQLPLFPFVNPFLGKSKTVENISQRGKFFYLQTVLKLGPNVALVGGYRNRGNFSLQLSAAAKRNFPLWANLFVLDKLTHYLWS